MLAWASCLTCRIEHYSNDLKFHRICCIWSFAFRQNEGLFYILSSNIRLTFDCPDWKTWIWIYPLKQWPFDFFEHNISDKNLIFIQCLFIWNIKLDVFFMLFYFNLHGWFEYFQVIDHSIRWKVDRPVCGSWSCKFHHSVLRSKAGKTCQYNRFQFHCQNCWNWNRLLFESTRSTSTTWW